PKNGGARFSGRAPVEACGGPDLRRGDVELGASSAITPTSCRRSLPRRRPGAGTHANRHDISVGWGSTDQRGAPEAPGIAATPGRHEKRPLGVRPEGLMVLG